MRPAKTTGRHPRISAVMRNHTVNAGLFTAALLLTACGVQTSNTPVFHESGNPALLSDWNVLRVDSSGLQPNDGVVPYDLNSALFTDYAHKFRTIWMPEGTSAQYRESDVLDFPVGTIISKTFYYPVGDKGEDHVLRTDDTSRDFAGTGLNLDNVKLMETRILAHRAEGWIALPYVWNSEETEARLKRVGDIQKLTLVSESGEKEPFPYVVPNANQCAGCHATNATTRAIQPIGPAARHLNKPYTYMDGAHNQLTKLASVNYLTGLPEIDSAPKSADWKDAAQTLDARARAYLDINCTHCHNKVGPADTSGLHFEPETEYGPNLGICKVSIAAGAGTGGRDFDIIPGEPDGSILTYRLDSKDPGIMMPELGRSTIHKEGVALLEQWIAEMQGNCD